MASTTNSSSQINQVLNDPTIKQSESTLKKGDSSIVTIRKIIDQARHKPVCFSTGLKLGLLSAFLFYLSFNPLSFSMLNVNVPVLGISLIRLMDYVFPAFAWIAFVPVISLIQIPRPISKMYLALYICGVAQFMPLLQWMRLGDPMMYIAWGIFSLYLGCYLPLFVGISRIGVHRHQWPIVLVVPLIWTAGEVLRGYLFTGFTWYYLGHSQYRWLELIQISDLTGSYGVSFVMMMINAAICMNLPISWYRYWNIVPGDEAQFYEQIENSRSKHVMKYSLVTVCFFCLVVSYGFVRRSQAQFVAGPRVAIIQGSVPASLTMEGEKPDETLHLHQALTARCVYEQPDLIIWPEGMFRWPLFSRHPELKDEDLFKITGSIPVSLWSDYQVHRTLQEISERANAAMIIGIMSFDADKTGVKHYNSAVFVNKKKGIINRYNKQHLVIFGEYIPLLETFPFLKIFTPIASEIKMLHGAKPQNFELGSWELVPNICYEDTVPSVVSRGLLDGKNNHDNKILVNLSNDGWFHGSQEHDQHLVTSLFRAIENRAPMVRSVNMGISAIIDGDGAILKPEHFIDGEALDEKESKKRKTSMQDPVTGRYYRKMPLAMVSTVPLDPRNSFYSYSGDWFGYLCWLVGGFFITTKLFGRNLKDVR